MMNKIDLKLSRIDGEDDLILRNCIVQSTMITSKDICTPLNEGDCLHNFLSDGIVEKYKIEEVILNKGMHSHYEIYVSKIN